MDKKRARSQIATIIVFIMVAVFLFVLITLNINRIVQKKTVIDNVADTVGLAMSSQLTSMANSIRGQLGIENGTESCEVDWKFLVTVIAMFIAAAAIGWVTGGIGSIAIMAVLKGLLVAGMAMGAAAIGFATSPTMQLLANNPTATEQLSAKMASLSALQQLIEMPVQSGLLTLADDIVSVTDTFDYDNDKDTQDKIPRFLKWYNLRLDSTTIPQVGKIVHDFMVNLTQPDNNGQKRFNITLNATNPILADNTTWIVDSTHDSSRDIRLTDWLNDMNTTTTTPTPTITGFKTLLTKLRTYGYGININVDGDGNIGSLVDTPDTCPSTSYGGSISNCVGKYEEGGIDSLVFQIQQFEQQIVKNFYNTDENQATAGVDSWVGTIKDWSTGLDTLLSRVTELKNKLQDRISNPTNGIHQCTYNCVSTYGCCANSNPYPPDPTFWPCCPGSTGTPDVCIQNCNSGASLDPAYPADPRCVSDTETFPQCRGPAGTWTCASTGKTCCGTGDASCTQTNPRCVGNTCQTYCGANAACGSTGDYTVHPECKAATCTQTPAGTACCSSAACGSTLNFSSHPNCSNGPGCGQQCCTNTPSSWPCGPGASTPSYCLSGSGASAVCDPAKCCAPACNPAACCTYDYNSSQCCTYNCNPAACCTYDSKPGICCRYNPHPSCVKWTGMDMQVHCGGLCGNPNAGCAPTYQCTTPLANSAMSTTTPCCTVVTLEPYNEPAPVLLSIQNPGGWWYVDDKWQPPRRITKDCSRNIINVFPYTKNSAGVVTEWHDAIWALNNFINDINYYRNLFSTFTQGIDKAETDSYKEMHEAFYVWSDFIGGLESQKQEVGHVVYVRLDGPDPNKGFTLPYISQSHVEWKYLVIPHICVGVGGMDLATSFFDITMARFDQPTGTRGRQFVYSKKLTAAEQALLQSALIPEAHQYNNNIAAGNYYMVNSTSSNYNNLKALLRKGISTTVRVHYGIDKQDMYIDRTSRGQIP
jgi:hypothetical protein